jgi:hypothetical protein
MGYKIGKLGVGDYKIGRLGVGDYKIGSCNVFVSHAKSADFISVDFISVAQSDLASCATAIAMFYHM